MYKCYILTSLYKLYPFCTILKCVFKNGILILMLCILSAPLCVCVSICMCVRACMRACECECTFCVLDGMFMRVLFLLCLKHFHI